MTPRVALLALEKGSGSSSFGSGSSSIGRDRDTRPDATVATATVATAIGATANGATAIATGVCHHHHQQTFPGLDKAPPPPPPPPFHRHRHYNIILELRQQCATALPTLAALVISKLPWLISLRFVVGGWGERALASAALATTLWNVTGLSLSVGLSSAVTTLAGQARGEYQQQLQQQQQLLLLNMTMKRKKQSRQSRQQPSSQQQKEDNATKDDDDDERGPLLLNHGAVKQYHHYLSLEDGDDDNDDEDNHQTNSNTNTTTTNTTTANTNNDDNNDRNERQPLLPLVYLYRGILVQFCVVLPVGIWWLHGLAPLLIALGQGPSLAVMTQDYLRILTPGLWSYSLNWTLTAWLQTMELSDVTAYASAVGMLLHIPLNWFFMYTLGWGYLGGAAATLTFQCIQPLLMLFYLFVIPSGRQRLLHHMHARAVGRTSLSFFLEARQALHLRGIGVYLSLALPGIVGISEWWASEVAIFLSGRLQPRPELSLGAMTLYQSINAVCFMFPMACSVAGAMRVSNLLGAGDPYGARLAGQWSVLCALAVTSVGSVLLLSTPHTLFPSWFAPHEYDLAHEVSRTIPYLALYIVGDGLQCAFTGIAKGCGRQVVTMPIVVFAYWVVGLPLAYYLTFVRHEGSTTCPDDDSGSSWCGVVGLVVGMTTGTWVHAILLGLAVVCTTNWKLEAQRAKERLDPPSSVVDKRQQT